MIELLDGSIGRELSEKGINVTNPLWASTALLKSRELVVELYEEYLEAGSSVLTSNTYGLKPQLFNNDFTKLESLFKVSVDVISEACENKNKECKIALSFPPLRNTYNPKIVPSDKEICKEYSSLFEITKHLKHNFVLVETLSTIREAENVLRVAKNFVANVWISFTLKNEYQLRSGERIELIIGKLGHLNPGAILFNCCRPEYITNGLSILKRNNASFNIGGYANRFDSIKEDYSFDKDGPNKILDMSTESYTRSVEKWLENNATIVGGCCGIGPRYIQSIYNLLKEKEIAINTINDGI